MNRLSIITINYNNKSGLDKTIQSVINQTKQAYEWIVIDGGSTDGSYELIFKYKHYFSYWCSEKDNGIYNAMNKGIKEATGDYLLFLNSGDYLANNSVISKIYKENVTEDLAYGYLERYYNKRIKIEKYFDRDNLTAADFIRNTLPHQATLIKRCLFEVVGLYDEDYKIVSDWKFFLEAVVFHNATTKQLRFTIVHFENEGISSKNHELNFRERQLVLEELIPKRILDDYSYILSLQDVYRYPLLKISYSILYRISSYLKKYISR